MVLSPTMSKDFVDSPLAEVLDREEWDAMDEAEQANEDINDILRVDTKAAHQYLAAGRSLLR